MLVRIFSVVAVFAVAAGLGADPPASTSPRTALQPFGDLIGVWNGTGTPAGSREDAQRGFWTEKMSWEWHFKGQDAWLKVAFDKSKHFTAGELRAIPDKDLYALTLTTPAKDKITFTGTLRNKVLTLDRDADKENQRLVFTFLHSNRFLYRYEVKPESRPLFSKKWSVGATKEGVPFAVGDGRPECVVSGGAGTSTVSYMGKTYYVCCSGCRSEFNENPAKYVQEYEAKKAKKK